MFTNTACRPLFVGLILVLSTAPQRSLAQEFRVYTSVVDRTAGGNDKPRTSLTVFHAGKVYDYIESAEETVIFQSAQNRFVVLSKRHDLATEIRQDEVRRFLDLARSHARELISEWQRDGAERREAIAALEFQLLPEFEVHDDTEAKLLTLTSPQLCYQVKYADAPSPEIVQTYLKAADWTAQLNAVLHPHALLPDARMRLNEELRTRGVLPVEVDLRIEGSHPIHLTASHVWSWKLLPFDRKFIDDREQQLRQVDGRLMPFRDFQRETLISQRKR